MSGLNLSRFCAIAILVALGLGSVTWGQNPAVPETPPFHALTEADVQAVLLPVQAAAIALDQRFASAGDSAAGWKAYLAWDSFKAELQKAKPDTAVLQSVYEKLAAGYEGLELKWFANLRTALGNYLPVADYAGKPELEALVKGQIGKLQQQIRSLNAHITTEEAHTLAERVHWLETLRQAPELVREARQRFSAPNFHVQIGSDLLAAGVGGPIDEVAPIDDVILKTVVHGTGRTVGETKASLPPSADFAMFDAMLEAINYSNNVGRNGPVCIYSTGVTGLSADKRLWIDATGLHTHPAAAAANAQTTINNIVSIRGRKFVEKIAWRRAGQQLGEAQAIASQHAASRLSARVDQQVEPMMQKANEQFMTKLRQPLDERRAFSQAMRFDTLATALEIHGTQALETQLAAPLPPPELTRPADVTVRLHESAINNIAETIFTGMRLNDDMVQRAALALLGKLPPQLEPDQNKEPFTIVFPAEEKRVPPFTISFAKGGFTATLRGKEFFTGEQSQPGMNITATYQFVKTPDGYRAVRQGDLQIYGFGLVPGAKRSLGQQGIYTALQRKFGKIFAPDIKLEGFKFESGKLAAAGRLVPQEIIAEDGWLAVGYQRVKSSGPATAAN
jgi:hypothetical protein